MLFVLCSLITFGLCFLIIAKIVLLFKQAQDDTSRVFQIPKGFPRFKNKWIDRLVILLGATPMPTFGKKAVSFTILIRTDAVNMGSCRKKPKKAKSLRVYIALPITMPYKLPYSTITNYQTVK